MINKKILAGICFWGATIMVHAQESKIHNDPAKDLKDGIELANSGKYNIASEKFEDFIESYADKPDAYKMLLGDAYYYRAKCAKETFNSQAEALYKEYLAEFKGHANNNIAYFDLGDIYYYDKNYQDALNYFKDVDTKEIKGDLLNEYTFKKSFSHFALKEFNNAIPGFKQLSMKEGAYYEQSNYYLGLSQYYTSKYKDALETFKKIETTKAYDDVVPYYITQIKFILKDYQGTIDYAEPKLSKTQLKNLSDMNHLVGMSYFQLKDYAKSQIYLENYIQAAATVSQEDYYQLGYIYYKQKNYAKAVENFSKLSHLDNALAQNAMFTMGECYVKLNDKVNARNAYLSASKMKFDATIPEEAYFQYAKLTYDLGNNTEALSALQNFKSTYPGSKYTTEADELLAQVLLGTANYDEALTTIDGMKEKTPKIQEIYQKMAYYRAVELFNDGNFTKSEEYINRSMKYLKDKSIEALCYYLKADIYHQQSQLDKSTEAAQKFLTYSDFLNSNYSAKASPGMANYIIGYNYYKKNDFSKAKDFFEKADDQLAASKDKNIAQVIYPDAVLRAADCYFMSKNYPKAIQYYNKVVTNGFTGSDYAFFQKSILEGLSGNYDEKIIGLKVMSQKFPNSLYADNALYELGNTYMLLSKNGDAISSYNSVINGYPKSDLVPEAYLKLGLIAYNEDRLDDALKYYKTAIDKYPKTNAANEALMIVKDVYIAKGDPDGYINFLKQYPGASVSVSTQDSVAYLSAETQFAKGNYEAALKSFNNYLIAYPNGYFALQAHFYRGECYFKNLDYDKAAIDYDYVTQSSGSLFTEKAVAKQAAITYKQANYTKSFDLYKKYKELASTDDAKREALLGLMRSSYKAKSFNDCVTYATEVLSTTGLSDYTMTEAKYFRGLSYYETQSFDKSKADLKEVISKVSNEQAAESKFKIAKMQYLQKQYTECEATCFEFIDTYPSYQYWLVNVYLLLADVYITQEEYFQAKATLQSILDNYDKEDDLRKQAQNKYNQVVELETKKSKIQAPNNSGTMEFNND
ncbi:MAG: tetratricopeptide repeat protein [Chitinophagales bacterium]|nr:tetratricopeptide repeat protein [Chitinophagales bacterium]